jgi:hypothetical protein
LIFIETSLMRSQRSAYKHTFYVPYASAIAYSQADKTAALFTRDGEQVTSLYDMQHVWYELAAGASYLRRKEYGKVGRQQIGA